MALTTIPGQGVWIPEPNFGNGSISGNLLIDATGEKAAIMGRVFNKDRATKSVHKIGFRFGTITKAGGSGLTVSLQDVDLANGPVMRPDGTQDQTVAISNGDSAFASNTWIQTAALSADRSVAFGELLAVVIEYDGSGRLGSDSVVIAGHSTLSGAAIYHQSQTALFTASWASQDVIPNVILEFSDGTFGTFKGSEPFSALSTQSFKQDTAGSDEYALEFSLPFPCKTDGFWMTVLGNANTNNFDVVLYDGTSAMTGGTVSIDANALVATGRNRLLGSFSQEISLAANTVYRLAVKPTQTTGNVSLAYFDVNDANHLQALAGGTSWRWTSRLDLGSWAAATTTRRPLAGIHLSAFDNGVGGSPPVLLE